jgi:regulator of RNase E activity RraA
MAVELALIEQLREFESALITEALGALGCPQPERYYAGSEIRLLTQMNEPLAGVALTMTCDTSTPGNKPDAAGLWECYAQASRSPVPVVVIMQAVGSRPRFEAVMGDGMAKMMKASNIVGIVSNGGARDIERINKVGFTFFGSGTVSNHVPPVYRLAREPVTVGGVTFANGDLVFGDSDGVILIPPPYQAAVVEACIYARDWETRVHTFWRRSDKTLEDKKAWVMRLWGEHQARCQALLSAPAP